MTRLLQILTIFVTLRTGWAENRVEIRGRTLDCLNGKIFATRGVEVFILRPSDRLNQLIQDMRTASDDNIFDRFNALIRHVRAQKALARTKSDRFGSFTATIPSDDRVMVFGYLESEDNPLYWMSAETKTKGVTSVTVTLDYCKSR